MISKDDMDKSEEKEMKKIRLRPIIRNLFDKSINQLNKM